MSLIFPFDLKKGCSVSLSLKEILKSDLMCSTNSGNRCFANKSIYNKLIRYLFVWLWVARSQIILKTCSAQSAARVSALNRNSWFLDFIMLLLTCMTAFTITISFGLFLFCLFQYRKKRSSTVSQDIELGL